VHYIERLTYLLMLLVAVIVGVIHNGDLSWIICLMYLDVGRRLVDMYTYQNSKFGGVRLGLIWIVVTVVLLYIGTLQHEFCAMFGSTCY
jgi:hypothetical protein